MKEKKVKKKHSHTLETTTIFFDYKQKYLQQQGNLKT